MLGIAQSYRSYISIKFKSWHVDNLLHWYLGIFLVLVGKTCNSRCLHDTLALTHDLSLYNSIALALKYLLVPSLPTFSLSDAS